MNWWMWAALGLVLAAGEILTPGGFFVIFFGLAALVVALLAFVGLAEALPFQILLFSVFSVASLLLFRNPLLRWMARHTPKTVDVNSFVGAAAGKRVECAERFASGDRGRWPLPRGAGGRPRNLD
jgi:membrane protein implicated in regulation of membrane protease activity